MKGAKARHSWPFRRLGDVARYVNGAAFKPSDWTPDGLPIIRIQNLTDPTAPCNRYSGELDKKFRVHDGDLLVSWSATLDVFRWQGGPAWLNQHIFRVDEDASLVTRDYLTFAIKYALAELQAQAHGTTMLHIKRGPFEDTQIPVPPLTEQRRLVARIEALTSRLEIASQARGAALAEAESVQAALVDSVFTKRNGDWDEATVKQLCGHPQYGYTESASHEEVGPRFLRITDIQEGKVDWETVPYCWCDEPAKYRLADGDIVFARTGATTGKSYIVHKPPEAVFASYLIRIHPGERVLPEYVWWYFQSSGYWHSVFSGTAEGNRPNMNGSKLAALRIPFPKDKMEQRRIVARLDTLAAKQAELWRLQTETEAQMIAFIPALLAKAFHGEL